MSGQSCSAWRSQYVSRETSAQDTARDSRASSGEHVGCELLFRRLRQLDAAGAGPHLHVHGDIHEAAGVYAPPLGAEGCITANAAALDGGYRLVHPPVVVDLAA